MVDISYSTTKQSLGISVCQKLFNPGDTKRREWNRKKEIKRYLSPEIRYELRHSMAGEDLERPGVAEEMIDGRLQEAFAEFTDNDNGEEEIVANGGVDGGFLDEVWSQPGQSLSAVGLRDADNTERNTE